MTIKPEYVLFSSSEKVGQRAPSPRLAGMRYSCSFFHKHVDCVKCQGVMFFSLLLLASATSSVRERERDFNRSEAVEKFCIIIA